MGSTDIWTALLPAKPRCAGDRNLSIDGELKSERRPIEPTPPSLQAPPVHRRKDLCEYVSRQITLGVSTDHALRSQMDSRCSIYTFTCRSLLLGDTRVCAKIPAKDPTATHFESLGI